MFRTIGRILTIVLVASLIGGVTYLLVQTLGAQSAAMQSAGGSGNFGGPGNPSASFIGGLGQLLLNLVEAGVIIAVVYPLQRWWLNRRQARSAQARRAVAATR